MRPIDDDPVPHDPPPPPTGTYPASNPDGSPLPNVVWYDTNANIDLHVDVNGFHYFDNTTQTYVNKTVSDIQNGYHVAGIDVILPTSTTQIGDGILPLSVTNAIDSGLDWAYHSVFVCGTSTTGELLYTGSSAAFSGSVCVTLDGQLYLAPGVSTPGAGWQFGIATANAQSYLSGASASIVMPDGWGGGTSIPTDGSTWDPLNSAILFGTPGATYSYGYNNTDALASSINAMTADLQATMSHLQQSVAQQQQQQYQLQQSAQMQATLNNLTAWTNQDSLGWRLGHGMMDDDWS